LQKTNKTILFFTYGIPILVITLGIIIGAWYYYLSLDPVKKELKSYLNNLNATLSFFEKSDIYHEYAKKVVGSITSKESESITEKYGHLKAPKLEAIFESEKRKNRNNYSFLERYKIRSEYDEQKLDLFSKYVVVTGPLAAINNHLLNYLDYNYKADSSFYEGMKFGYITNVSEPKQGGLAWKYPEDKNKRELSNNFKKYRKLASQEWNEFNAKLNDLAAEKNLDEQTWTEFLSISGYLK